MKLNNRITVTFIVILIAGLSAALYFFYFRPYMPKYKWTASYYYNDDQPYGTEILYKSLKASHESPDFNLINKSFDKQFKWEGTGNCYIFIGNNYSLTERESDSLFHFIEEGNTAFISTEYLTSSILLKLFPETELESYEDEMEEEEAAADNVIRIEDEEEYKYFMYSDSLSQNVKVHFFDSRQAEQFYSFHYQFKKNTIDYHFFSFNTKLLDDENHTYNLISYIDSIPNVNCISIEYGKGRLYLHANPIFFTNYFLSTLNGYNHANIVLSFTEKKKIYWDEINKMRTYGQNGNDYSRNESPFRYLLSQKSFRWAWYSLLAALALFLLFGSKRRQKTIPLTETDKNSSLAYVKAVAALYYQPRAHSAIAEEMWHLFCVFVKTKYGIDLKNEEKKQIEILSKVSKVDAWIIEEIVKLKNDMIYMFDGNKNRQLKMLQQLLEEFYKETT